MRGLGFFRGKGDGKWKWKGRGRGMEMEMKVGNNEGGGRSGHDRTQCHDSPPPPLGHENFPLLITMHTNDLHRSPSTHQRNRKNTLSDIPSFPSSDASFAPRAPRPKNLHAHDPQIQSLQAPQRPMPRLRHALPNPEHQFLGVAAPGDEGEAGGLDGRIVGLELQRALDGGEEVGYGDGGEGGKADGDEAEGGRERDVEGCFEGSRRGEVDLG